MIDPADIVAIQRAFEVAGRDGALTELRRRFSAVKYERDESALGYVLAMTVEPPEVRRGDRRAQGRTWKVRP